MTNDGGIHRGEGAETGDDEARPRPRARRVGETGDLDDLAVLDANDPTLGLTNTGDKGPDDWAADTGPTHTGEESAGIGTRGIADRSSTLGMRRNKP